MFLFVGCQTADQPNQPPTHAMPLRDINAVLKGHDRELMAHSGVVGIYVGLMKDDKTPCLRVMVIKATRELRQKIPASLEGYPVVIEETGVIKPM
jgi:hypothetical protein